jgi:hypothetical protein
MTVNGLVFAGNGIDSTGANNHKLTINGGLIIAGSSPFGASYEGDLSVTYAANKVVVPDFSRVGASPVNVQIVSYTP